MCEEQMVSVERSSSAVNLRQKRCQTENVRDTWQTSLTFRVNCSKMLVCVLSLPADS